MNDEAKTEFKPGDRVRFIPCHAFDDSKHLDCEDGEISSMGNRDIVFVRFDAAVSRLGWDGATSQACTASQLRRL